MGGVTPEDPYRVWHGTGGPVTIAPLFLLYDYTFRPDGAATKEAALAQAYAAGAGCTDQLLLHPDPHPSREAWSAARLSITRPRLPEPDPNLPTAIVTPLRARRAPTSC